MLNAIKTRSRLARLLLTALCLSLGAQSVEAQGDPTPRCAKLVSSIRLDPEQDEAVSAVEQLPACAEAPSTLAPLWASVRGKSQLLPRLRYASGLTRHPRVTAAVMQVVGDPQTDVEVRLAGLGVLAQHVEPTIILTEARLRRPLVGAPLPRTSHATALPDQGVDSRAILELLSRLATGEPNSVVGQAARWIYDGLRQVEK